MERKKASDFPPGVLKLFDGYVHGAISRREFLDGAAKFAVVGFSAAAMLEALRPNFAWAQQVAKTDPRISTDYQTYSSPQGTGTMRGLLARPANATGKLPGVVVIHENRGLNPYIEDVARRLATEGFIAFAPDALTPVGGYPNNEEQAAKMFGALDATKRTEDLLAAATYLKSRSDVGKFGATGFCFGGGIVNLMATRMPDMSAGVPFYGNQPAAAEAAKIRTPLLLHFAGVDDRINSGWPAFEAVLKANNVKHEARIYSGTQHGFHNDTTPRYDEASAKLAWSRTIAFFRENLKS